MKYQIIKLINGKPKYIVLNDLSLQDAEKMLRLLNGCCKKTVKYKMREVRK